MYHFGYLYSTLQTFIVLPWKKIKSKTHTDVIWAHLLLFIYSFPFLLYKGMHAWLYTHSFIQSGGHFNPKQYAAGAYNPRIMRRRRGLRVTSSGLDLTGFQINHLKTVINPPALRKTACLPVPNDWTTQLRMISSSKYFKTS